MYYLCGPFLQFRDARFVCECLLRDMNQLGLCYVFGSFIEYRNLNTTVSFEVGEFRFKRFKNSLRHDFQDLYTPVVLKYRQDDMTH